jgi:hypothetical protein
MTRKRVAHRHFEFLVATPTLSREALKVFPELAGRRRRARVFQARCRLHRKRESQHHATG